MGNKYCGTCDGYYKFTGRCRKQESERCGTCIDYNKHRYIDLETTNKKITELMSDLEMFTSLRDKLR